MIQIKDHKNLYRDEQSGAIVSNDTYGYEQYIRIKEEKQRQKEEIINLRKEIDNLKNLVEKLLNEPK